MFARARRSMNRMRRRPFAVARPRRRGFVAAAAPVVGDQRHMNETSRRAPPRRRTAIGEFGIIADNVSSLDDLSRARARIDKAVGRAVAPVASRPQVAHRDAGPVVVGRSIDRRHAARDRAAVPVRVIDQDLARTDDPGNHRDMARRRVAAPPEHQDRAQGRALAALIAACGLVPPAAGGTIEVDASLGPHIEGAVCRGTRPVRCQQQG